MFTSDKKTTTGVSADSISYWLLLVLAAVLPVAVFTAASVPSTMTKIVVSGVLILLAFVFFAIARMRRQELSIPRSFLLGVAWLIPVAYLLSMLFASSGTLSFFGERLHMDSVAFISIAILALTLTALVVDSTKRALGVYLAMLASAAILTVLELIIFFAREGVASTGMILQSLSLVGSLNDLAVFFGLIVIFVLISLILLPVSAVIRGVLWVSLVASAFFLTVVNLTVLWWIIGVFALGAFVYSVSAPYLSRTDASLWRGQIESLAILILCSIFLFGSNALTAAPASWTEVGELEVRPAWQTTASIGRQALDGQAIFGAGPGSFSHAWGKYMPAEINLTAFWQTDFIFGIGLVPTLVISTGLMGVIAWLLFFIMFLWNGFRSLMLSRNAERGDIVYYLRITSFLSAAYLWVIAIIQVPSPAILIYAALLTGVFIASLGFGGDAVRHINLQFRDNPRVGFAVTLVLTFAILVSVGGVYSLTTRFMAELAFQNALRIVSTTGDVDAAQDLLQNQAIHLNETDTYYRLLSSINVIHMQQLLAENRPPEEIRTEFENLLGRAITSANKATELDRLDYQNWLNLGTVYQSIVPLGIEGSVDQANEAYDRVLELRPFSPFVYLSKATLARAVGDTAQARVYVEEAIALRGQYTDAIFFLAQMQLEDNDLENALRSVGSVTVFEPNNPVAFFQLGLLQYGSESYIEAAQAFERATVLNPVYANAHYFLGLTYWRLGNNERAVTEFEFVLATNKDNSEVTTIIANLNAGRDPFASLSTSPDIGDLSGLPVGGADLDDAAVNGETSKNLSE